MGLSGRRSISGDTGRKFCMSTDVQDTIKYGKLTKEPDSPCKVVPGLVTIMFL